MIIIVIKEPNVESPCAEQISKDYPDCCVFNYKQFTDQELLEAADEPMLVVLNHRMAIPHAKLLRLAAGERLLRIMVVLEEGFAMHAINARISGADSCLAMPYEPVHLLRAIEEGCTILRRLAEAQGLVNSQASINRKYTLGAVLGAGRHSVMILSNVIKTGEMVVIKLYRKSLASSAEFMAELKAKAVLLKEIAAPSMAEILDFGNWNGYAYLVLQIGKGENLYQVMSKRKLDEHEIAKIALALTRALIAIKKCGMLHFDLKPENIIYYQNNYYLSEFGSLLPVSKADYTGFQYWPDAAFTCPETFIDGSLFTARSDVYSLGLILYAMLRRENPFAGRPCSYELQQRVSQDLVNFQQVNPIEGNPIMAIAIEAMTLCRQEARPRLRDLEIIFYQMVLMTSSKTSAIATSPTELPSQVTLHKNKRNSVSDSASENEDAEFKRQATRPGKDGSKSSPFSTSAPPAKLTLADVYSLKKRLLLLGVAVLVIGLVLLGGTIYGRQSMVRTHYQQGPLRMFTCYSGHTHPIRTLDLRNVYCPECGDPTSPSYTCQKCEQVFGLTLWPKRDMSEDECAKFEEKQTLCPFCKSPNIAMTPVSKSSKKKK